MARSRFVAKWWRGAGHCAIWRPPFGRWKRAQAGDLATARLMRKRRLALVDAPQLYLYVRHGDNTFDENASRASGRWRMRGLKARIYVAMLRSLAEAFPFGDYPDARVLSGT